MSNRNSKNKFWWEMLPSIPKSADDPSYKRLARIWRDNTRFRGKAGTPKRKHEFYIPHHETHLTSTLFENFSLFTNGEWISDLLECSGLNRPIQPIQKFAWSYEWEKKLIVDGKRVIRLCDVVISYKDNDDNYGVVVVESKALGKKPGKKDFDLDYYLSIPDFDKYQSNIKLIYCVDEKVRDWVNERRPEGTGLITWQDLGALQIKLAHKLEIEQHINHYICSSIQYQYLLHEITPSILGADYLFNEPSLFSIDAQKKGNRQTILEREHALWDITA